MEVAVPEPRLLFSCLILDRRSLMVFERPDMMATAEIYRQSADTARSQPAKTIQIAADSIALDRSLRVGEYQATRKSKPRRTECPRPGLRPLSQSPWAARVADVRPSKGDGKARAETVKAGVGDQGLTVVENRGSEEQRASFQLAQTRAPLAQLRDESAAHDNCSSSSSSSTTGSARARISLLVSGPFSFLFFAFFFFFFFGFIILRPFQEISCSMLSSCHVFQSSFYHLPCPSLLPGRASPEHFRSAWERPRL